MATLINALISRRTMIETGLLAGAGAVLARWATAADQSSLPVIKKKIPSTGEEIPVIGIGTNAFRGANYQQLRDILKRMHELKGSVIDTAAMYGDSEAVIGKALTELGIRKQMFIATKFNSTAGGLIVGPPPGAIGAPPPGAGAPPAGGGSSRGALAAGAQRTRNAGPSAASTRAQRKLPPVDRPSSTKRILSRRGASPIGSVTAR